MNQPADYRRGGGYNPWRKVRHAVNGLVHAVRHDVSVAYKIPVSVVVIVTSIFFARWVDLILVAKYIRFIRLILQR